MRNGLCGVGEAPPRRTKQRTFSHRGRGESPVKQNQAEEV